MKKKLICSLLTAIMLLIPTVTTFASTNTNISKETVVEENSKNKSKIKLNEREKQALSELNISEDDIIVLDKNSVFSNEDLKKIESAEAKDETDGFKKVEEIIFEVKQPKSVYSKSASSHPDGIKRIDKVRLYVDGPVTLNKNNHGMKYWLDVSWNLIIGTYTQKAWKAATILGLNPSNFLPTADPGDKLTRTYQKVYRDYYYTKYNPLQHKDNLYVRTSALELTTYLDLYTVDKNNKAVRCSEHSENKYYTQYYGNGTWIYNEVNRRCNSNIQVCYLDTFK